MQLPEHSLKGMLSDFSSLFLSCSWYVNMALEAGTATLDHKVEAMCHKWKAASWKEAGSLVPLMFRTFHVRGVNHLI